MIHSCRLARYVIQTCYTIRCLLPISMPLQPHYCLLVTACMALFRRRQGYLSGDYFSVTPVFRTESMLLLKSTFIFLKAPSVKQSFSIFTCCALVRNRTLMISCLCNVLFMGLQHDTTLDSLSALDREISLKNIHTYIHTFIQAWREPVFHRLLESGFAPSALSLRLSELWKVFWSIIPFYFLFRFG